MPKVETTNVKTLAPANPIGGTQESDRASNEGAPPPPVTPERKVIFRRLHAAATLPSYNPITGTFTLFMCDITESGRPNVIGIPPHSLSRPIPTGVAPVTLGRAMGLIVSRGSGLGEGIFAPSVAVPYHDALSIRVFNWRHEAKRLLHGEPIAELVLIDGSAFAGPAEWSDDNAD